jgi:hypothetical protein
METAMVVLALAYAGTVGGLLRFLAAERREGREHVERLEGQIILLKVDPPQAAVSVAPQVDADEFTSFLGDDSPAADQAWAEVVERNRS